MISVGFDPRRKARKWEFTLLYWERFHPEGIIRIVSGRVGSNICHGVLIRVMKTDS